MLKSIYTLCIICLSLIIQAQGLRFEKFTTKDGLLSDDVYKIFQDKKGYIWLFTNHGAMKYNGKTFEPTLKNLSFKESFIYSYYENNKGQLWVANANANIYEVKNDSAILIKGIDTLSQKLKKSVNEIYQLYADKNSNIYVSTKNGGYKLTKNKKYTISNLWENPDADSVAVYLFNIENEIIPVSSPPYRKHINVNVLHSYNLKYINQNNKSDSYNARFIGSGLFMPCNFKRYDKDIYFSFHNQLIKLKENKTIQYIPLNSFVLNYTQDKRKHTWVGTYNNGLFELNERDSIINHYLLGKTVNHLLIDSQDGLWVSTDGFGLFHCLNVNETHYTETESLGNPISFIKNIDNKLFLANALGEIYIIDGNKTIKLEQDKQASTDVLDIIKYRDGYIISYRFYLYYLNLNGGLIKTKLPLINPPFHPFKLFNLGEDSVLCMGRKTILKLKEGIKSIPKKNEIITFDIKIFSFAIRSNQQLIGSDDGVYELINNKLSQPTYLLPTKNRVITKIIKDNFDNYWFCTKGSGLFKLNKKNELKQYTITSNLPSNIIYDISFNTDNSILLCTNKGLFYSDGLNSDFKKWNELYSEEVKSAISYNNALYLATKNGLVTIKENNTAITNKPIYLNVTSILINGLNKSKKELRQLHYNENNIEVNVDIISYSTNIPKIKYELSGTRNEGGIKSLQQISFQNLEPGNYKLELSLLLNEYNDNSTIIEFSIIPAFWQTLWFKALVIVLSLVICIIVAWLVFKYLKNKEDKKNEANKLITEYKLIALKAQINPHFMSNCLTAIQHLILSNHVNEANQYLAKFSLLVRQVLNFSTKSLVTLHEELQITELNIELEQLRFENNFEFKLELNEALNLKDINIPPLLLQPIIENAIWHGLLPLKKLRKGKLIIKIYSIDNLLYLIIEDNGVGRKNEKFDIGNLKESKGIMITKQRIQNLNIYYKTSRADLYYEDLMDETNNSMGTRVTIVLPINLEQ